MIKQPDTLISYDKPTRHTNFSNLFWKEDPDPACKLSEKPVWHIQLLCVQCKIPDDGQRGCPKQVDFSSKINFKNYCIWLVYYKIFIHIMYFVMYCESHI